MFYKPFMKGMRIMSEKPRPDDPGDLPEHHEPGNHLWSNPVMQKEGGRVNISGLGSPLPGRQHPPSIIEISRNAPPTEKGKVKP